MKTTKIWAGLAVAGVLLAGCGGDEEGGSTAKSDESKAEKVDEKEQDDPKATLMDALEKSQQAQDLTTVMKLDTSSELLRALQDESGSTDPSADKFMDLLPKSSLTVHQFSRDEALAEEQDPQDLDTDMVLQLGSAKVEIRMVEGGLYARADVEKLGQETGLFSADELRSSLGQAPSGDPTAQLAHDLLAGKWVGMTAEQVEAAGLTETLEQSVAGQSEVATDPAQQQAMLKDLEGLVDEHGEFTRDGDVITAALPVEKSWDDFAKVVNKYNPDAAEDEKMPMLDDEARQRIKDDATAEIEFTVQDGDLTGTTIDLAQFTGWIDESSLEDDEKQEFAEVKKSFDEGPLKIVSETQIDQGAPTAPDSFTEVPQELVDGMAQGAQQPGAASSSTLDG